MKREIDAGIAIDLIAALIHSHPWLIKPGVMQTGDELDEQEALAFLLSSELKNGWGETREGARRVVCHLLLDFSLKLGTPGHPISRKKWVVDGSLPDVEQALCVIAAEIRESRPDLPTQQ